MELSLLSILIGLFHRILLALPDYYFFIVRANGYLLLSL